MKILPSLFLAIAGICGVVMVWQLKQPSVSPASGPATSEGKMSKSSGSLPEHTAPRNLSSPQSVRPNKSVVPSSRQAIPALPMRTNTVAASVRPRPRLSAQAQPMRTTISSGSSQAVISGGSGSAPIASGRSTGLGAVAAPQFEEVEEVSQPPLAFSIPTSASGQLPAVEQTALTAAQEEFETRLSEYGPLDPSSEEYFHAYRESAQASDDFLRAYLGWDRYMSLSAEAIQQTTEQLAGTRGAATP